MFNTIIITLCLFIFLYLWIYNKFNYWKRFRIPQQNKSIIASLWRYLSSWRLSSHMMQLYEICRKEKIEYIGDYLFTRPILFVATPTLLKEIVVKNESHFRNRGSYRNDDRNLTNLNLFNMKDQHYFKWKKIMSLCFTTNKLKTYMKITEKYATTTFSVLNRTMLETSEGFDFFKLSNNFASAVSQHILLGVEEHDPDLVFNKIGKFDAVFTPKIINKFTDILSYYWPELLCFLGMTEFPSEAFNLVKMTLEDVMNNDKMADDSFPKQLIELMEKDEEIKKENILGVLSALFIGGLKSTTPLLAYASYELAKAPHVQEKLFMEILYVYNIHGEISYEALNEMAYMQQFLNEVMRIYNGGPLLIRECNQKCELTSGLVVDEGVLVISSIRGMLMDPEYFPQPEKFDPDRFSSQNLNYNFLPFGIGRHLCIGNKFALLQAKVFFIQLLIKYNLSINEKTHNKFTDRNARLGEDAIYLNITSRSH